MKKRISIFICLTISILLLFLYINKKNSYKEENVNSRITYIGKNEKWHKYSYDTESVREIRFYAKHINAKDIIVENIGVYALNNNYYNLSNIYNYSDKGFINLYLDVEENGFYFDCYSEKKKSKSTTLPTSDIFTDISYDDIMFELMNKEMKRNEILIMSGKSSNNEDTINVYMVME